MQLRKRKKKEYGSTREKKKGRGKQRCVENGKLA